MCFALWTATWMLSTPSTLSCACGRFRSEVSDCSLVTWLVLWSNLPATAKGSCLPGQAHTQVGPFWTIHPAADKRGYAAGAIVWQSQKKHKFHCQKCKRSFPRMEVLLQHFRDSARHRYIAATQHHCSVISRGNSVSNSTAVSCKCLTRVWCCSSEAISVEASVQLSNWLLAKDQKRHCCLLCCLGFQTEPELFVHLKHTAVHMVTSLS